MVGRAKPGPRRGQATPPAAQQSAPTRRGLFDFLSELSWESVSGVAVVAVVLIGLAGLWGASTLQDWEAEKLLYACRNQAIAAHYSAADVAKICALPKSSALDVEFQSISTHSHHASASAPTTQAGVAPASEASQTRSAAQMKH